MTNDEMDLEAVRDLAEAARQLAVAGDEPDEAEKRTMLCRAADEGEMCGKCGKPFEPNEPIFRRAMATSGYTTAVGAELLQYVLDAAYVWNGSCTWHLALAVAAPSTIQGRSNTPFVHIGAARILRRCNASCDATLNASLWFAQLAGSCSRHVGPAPRPAITLAARGYFGAAVGSA
jgi:hypothetical protein